MTGDLARLRSAVKRDDDLFATFCASPVSIRLVPLAARLGLSPSALTWLSVGAAVAAAASFGVGPVGRVIGAALLYAAFVLDCADGQLARYTGNFSRYGGWLDAMADRGKEFIVYAGLAAGSVVDVWWLAVVALMLLTVRHTTDAWYGAVSREAGPRTDGSRRRLYWLRRTLPFPIGERWLVIGATAALFDARVTFWALLSWGSFALVYTLAGRILRVRALRPQLPGIAAHRDTGWIGQRLASMGRGIVAPLPIAVASAIPPAALVLAGRHSMAGLLLTILALLAANLAGAHPHDGPLDWLVPAVMRSAELLFIVLAGQAGQVPVPLVYALLATVALYSYDLTARLDTGVSPVRHRRLALGMDGRIVVLYLASLLGVESAAFGALAVYLVVVFVASSTRAAFAPAAG